MYEKLETSDVFNSNSELKIQKQDSHFVISSEILIHVDNTIKYTQ